MPAPETEKFSMSPPLAATLAAGSKPTFLPLNNRPADASAEERGRLARAVPSGLAGGQGL